MANVWVNIRKFLGNRIKFKKEIKERLNFCTLPRQTNPTQEHLGLFVDCFGDHLLIIQILILTHLHFLTIFNFLKIHQFPPPLSFFTFTLQSAKKFFLIYGSSPYDPMIAFLD